MVNIKRPSLILDVEKVQKNIDKLKQKADRHEIKLSPHFKTHQSVAIGRWFQQAGVDSATVSSVSMARYFIDNGWKDVTIVFPLNILEIEEVGRLAEEAKLTVLIDSLDTVLAIKDKVDYPLLTQLEIDAGYHRTGIDATDVDQIRNILNEIRDAENLFFQGFYSHSGDTYKCTSKSEILDAHEQNLKALRKLRQEFSSEFPELTLSLGDTPSCSITENFEGIDIIRPGNFVFYDLMQVDLGACSYDEVAVAMACPVVYKNWERNEITLYGGGVHFAKDALQEGGVTSFGRMVEFTNDGWSAPIKGCFLKSISQEHGILHVTDEIFEKLSVGDIVGILPVHSCMTADVMGEYLTLEGETLDHMSGPKFRI